MKIIEFITLGLKTYENHKKTCYIKFIQGRCVLFMLSSLLLIAFGIFLSTWGVYRIKHDFKTNKTKNNIVGLFFSGQASGVGQFLSGVVTIVVGVIVMYINR